MNIILFNIIKFSNKIFSNFEITTRIHKMQKQPVYVKKSTGHLFRKR